MTTPGPTPPPPGPQQSPGQPSQPAPAVRPDDKPAAPTNGPAPAPGPAAPPRPAGATPPGAGAGGRPTPPGQSGSGHTHPGPRPGGPGPAKPAASPWGGGAQSGAGSADRGPQKPPQTTPGAHSQSSSDGQRPAGKSTEPGGKLAKAGKYAQPDVTTPQDSAKKSLDVARAGGVDAGLKEGAGQLGRHGIHALSGGATKAAPGGEALGKAGEALGKGAYKLTKLQLKAAGAAFLVLLFFLFGGASGLTAAFSGDPFRDHAPRPTDEQCSAMPEKWCDVVYDAQRGTHNSRISVPWTLIAGLANVQTDFGRVSPYDTKDRYPNRPVPAYLAANPGGMAVTGVTYTGPLGSVAGLNPEQMRNAKTIIETAAALGVPEYGQVIAVATALQESSLVNIHGGDRDSQGLFQQRPSMDWGTVAQITDPAYATTAFLTGAGTNPGLLDIDGWVAMPVTVAAQAVQRSGFPSAYAKHEPTARALVAKFGGTLTTSPTVQLPATSVVAPADSLTATEPTGGDPYVEEGGDGCDVAPPPTPIGGKPGQAAGPFLVNAAAAEELGDAAHNPCEAAAYVADKLADAANEVYKEGNYEFERGESAKAAAFWQQVVIRADVMVDPKVAANADCKAPGATADTPVDVLIDQIWSCELNRAPRLYVVDSASVDDDGSVSFSTYTRTTGTDVLIAEAKAVSWNFSKWNNDKCDPKATLAGIFPITQEQATAQGAANRCNRQANIRAAAQLVASGEAVEVADRGAGDGEPFAPMLGGWDQIPAALGTQRATFALTGPARDWMPTSSCTRVVTDYLLAAATEGSPFAQLAGARRLPQDTQPYDKTLRAAGTDPTNVADCAAPSAEVMADALARVADELALAGGNTAPVDDHAGESGDPAGNAGTAPALDSIEPTAPPVEELGYDPAAMRGLQVWFALSVDASAAPQRAVYGQDSMVDRLSPVSKVIGRGPVSGAVTVQAASWYTAATDWAIFYGGIVSPWDTFGKRTGSLLANAGQTAGTAGEWGTASQQAQIVIDAAKQYLGTPYSWGGGGPGGPSKGIDGGANIVGFDCSGLTEYAFSKVGYKIGTFTGEQINAGTGVRGGLGEALPGDLLFFPGHVAIYMGDNMLIHAPKPGDVVKIEKVYDTPTAIRRVLKDSALAAGMVVNVGSVSFPLAPGSKFTDQLNWGNGGSMWSSRHTGNDFSVACGTPVLAATAGVVEIREDQSWSGPWLVMVSTGPGRLTTWYAHMEKLNVRAGQKVQAGQQIGEVGTLGNSSGCHLHFEYHPRGGSIYEDNTDPVPWLRSAGAYPRGV